MRVALDMRVLERPELAGRGIGRYAASLYEALDPDAVIAIRSERLRRPPLPSRIAEVAEHVLLGRDARRAGADVLHSPSIDFATARPRMPYVITVHDLVPLKRPGDYLRTGLKHRLRYAAVKRATRVIAPTRTVAADCERLLGLDPTRVAVVAEAAAPVFRPVADTQRALARLELPDQFVLWVGGLDPPDPRKGVRELADAAARGSGLPLVLTGATSAEATGLASPGRVVLTGRVTDEELAALYTAATALVLPSTDEGFGLTVLEALACGTPAATFAIDSMSEQHADSPDVTLVAPGDYAALLDAAEAWSGHTAASPSRTWRDVAAETWAVYESSASAVRTA